MAQAKLTKKEVDDLRARLLEERGELQDQLTTIEDTSFSTTQSDLSGDVGLDDESADVGTATFEREKDLSIEQNVRDLLQKIDRALTRIDAGTYGVCDRCGKPIEKARVKALPYVDLGRSVPGYATLISMLPVLAQKYAKDHTRFYDLGCSLGAATLALRHSISHNDVTLIAVDNSAAMMAQCKRYIDQDTATLPVEFHCADICQLEITNASLVNMNFALQFIPPENRLALLKNIYAGLVPGGALVLSEKLLFAEPDQSLMTELHHTFKKLNGYSDLEISLKRSALENVLFGGRQGQWGPFLREVDPASFRRQVSRMIIEGSKAILEIKPDAVLIIPEPWHATDTNPEENQAAVLDTVLGRRDPELGGCSELVTIIGLNHYRDSTLPPFHRLLMNARKHWPDKQLWVTETSGPPVGWQQTEWFWWMLAETRLAAMSGIDIPVFTWAPAISMYDWVEEQQQLQNGIWILDEDGRRLPNGKMLEAIGLARQFGYIV